MRSPDLPMAVIDQALVTTNLAALTDSGAPVLDAEGRLVAMIYGGTDTETISVPIGNIKADFDQAFR
jgi:hypothetical protein